MMSSQNSPEVYVPTEIYSPNSENVVFVSRPRPRYWLNVLLLVTTFFTTLVVGARLEWNFLRGQPPFSTEIFPLRWALQGSHLALGIPFSLTLMLILLAHEMGHYLYCIQYGVYATLPFFIPFPTLIGTLGAFIRIRSPIRSRAELFDIGIAGPIAGFVVSVVVLAFGLEFSKAMTAPISALDLSFAPNYPLIFPLVHSFMTRVGLAHGTSGLPLDRLLVHPTVIAAWVGMFATSLNLLPGGQ